METKAENEPGPRGGVGFTKLRELGGGDGSTTLDVCFQMATMVQ